MNPKYVVLFVGGVILCVILGVFGWITVAGSSTERFFQLLIWLGPTIASLLGIQVSVQAQKTANETKAIVSPSNGEYMQRGQVAYEAYARRVDGKSFSGDRLPTFTQLTEQQRLAWYDAARAGNGEVVS